jgi:uncharacterized protein YbjT (DUF2867 family)
MTYVVAGVTGNTGSVVAHTLLAAGEKVRVIVRTAEKGQPFVAAGAEVAVADLGDREALTRALTGARGAYLLLPPVLAAQDFLAHQATVTEAIAAAVQAARVPHVVFLSSIAAEREAGTGPILTVARAERRFAALEGTAFTFLRPAYFMENFAGSLAALAQGVFNSFIAPGTRFATIATRDIGKAAAARLRAGARANEIVQLAGPEDVDIDEVVSVFSEQAKRSLKLELAPVEIMADVLAGYGLSRDIARLYAEMTGALNRGEIAFLPERPIERGTTSLREVARKLLA